MKKVKYVLMATGFALIFWSVTVNAQMSPNPIPKTIKTDAAVADYSLMVENEDGKSVKLTLGDLSKIKRQTVKVNDHGKETVFEGFALVEVLKLAGVEFGDALRGKRLATFLLVEAADGYQAVFALPELDPAFTDKLILLADKRDPAMLSKTEGQLRIVVPDEKKAARWVRQVTRMKILRVTAPNK